MIVHQIIDLIDRIGPWLALIVLIYVSPELLKIFTDLTRDLTSDETEVIPKSICPVLILLIVAGVVASILLTPYITPFITQNGVSTTDPDYQFILLILSSLFIITLVVKFFESEEKDLRRQEEQAIGRGERT